VYWGLPATAAVADMPVGTPSPFASALEPCSRPHADKRGNGLARAGIYEPLASCPDPAFKEGCAQDKNLELALNHRGRHERVAVHVVEGLEFRRRQHLGDSATANPTCSEP
jgi:hypothetical protein